MLEIFVPGEVQWGDENSIAMPLPPIPHDRSKKLLYLPRYFKRNGLVDGERLRAVKSQGVFFRLTAHEVENFRFDTAPIDQFARLTNGVDGMNAGQLCKRYGFEMTAVEAA